MSTSESMNVGHFVVHHIAVAEFAVLVDHLLHQRMAQTHDDGTLDLLKTAGGIDGLAYIVGGTNQLHLYVAAPGIHSHHGGLSAVHPHDGGTAGLPAVHRRRIKDVGGAIAAQSHHRRAARA